MIYPAGSMSIVLAKREVRSRGRRMRPPYTSVMMPSSRSRGRIRQRSRAKRAIKSIPEFAITSEARRGRFLAPNKRLEMTTFWCAIKKNTRSFAPPGGQECPPHTIHPPSTARRDAFESVLLPTLPCSIPQPSLSFRAKVPGLIRQGKSFHWHR